MGTKMKNIKTHTFDAQSGRQECGELSTLLQTYPTLSERRDILPFFKSRHDLSVLICTYFPKIANPNCFAHEFEIYGDFVADLIVGDSSEQRYVLVEFENGAKDSIFKQKGAKATPDWASRFESAYSQLIDWIWKLEDMRQTSHFQTKFGSSTATFHGLIVIGKDMALAPQEEARLKWRMDQTRINSKEISVVSFNQLHDDLDGWLKRYHGV